MLGASLFAESQAEEGRYRLLVEAITDYAIYMLDPGGMVSSWNSGAERFKGYRAEEIIGQHFSRFYPEEDRARGLPEEALRTARDEGRFEAEAKPFTQGDLEAAVAAALDVAAGRCPASAA